MTVSLEAELARAISEVLLAYAEENTCQGAEAAVMPGPLAGDAALPAPRGPRQKDIAELLVSAPIEGFKTGDVAHLVTMDQPNAYLSLHSLARQGIAELVPGSDPRRWRLLPRYRQRR
jgi:hypothetical protein